MPGRAKNGRVTTKATKAKNPAAAAARRARRPAAAAAAAAAPPAPPATVSVWTQYFSYNPDGRYAGIDPSDSDSSSASSPSSERLGAFECEGKRTLSFPANLREREVGAHRMIRLVTSGSSFARGEDGPVQGQALVYQHRGPQGTGWYKFGAREFVQLVKGRAMEEEGEVGGVGGTRPVLDVKVFVWGEEQGAEGAGLARMARRCLAERGVPKGPPIMKGMRSDVPAVLSPSCDGDED